MRFHLLPRAAAILCAAAPTLAAHDLAGSHFTLDVKVHGQEYEIGLLGPTLKIELDAEGGCLVTVTGHEPSGVYAVLAACRDGLGEANRPLAEMIRKPEWRLGLDELAATLESMALYPDLRTTVLDLIAGSGAAAPTENKAREDKAQTAAAANPPTAPNPPAQPRQVAPVENMATGRSAPRSAVVSADPADRDLADALALSLASAPVREPEGDLAAAMAMSLASAPMREPEGDLAAALAQSLATAPVRDSQADLDAAIALSRATAPMLESKADLATAIALSLASLSAHPTAPALPITDAKAGPVTRLHRVVDLDHLAVSQALAPADSLTVARLEVLKGATEEVVLGLGDQIRATLSRNPVQARFVKDADLAQLLERAQADCDAIFKRKVQAAGFTWNETAMRGFAREAADQLKLRLEGKFPMAAEIIMGRDRAQWRSQLEESFGKAFTRWVDG